MKTLGRLTAAFAIIAASSTIVWAAASLMVSGTMLIASVGPAESETETPQGYYDGYGIPVDIQFDGEITGTATFRTDLHVDGATGNGVTSSVGTAHITSIAGEQVSIDMAGRAWGTLEGWINTGRMELHAKKGRGSNWIEVDLHGYVFGPWAFSGEAKFQIKKRKRQKNDHGDGDFDEHDDHGHGRGHRRRG